jgi:two-component system sensor histidine kinase DegS
MSGSGKKQHLQMQRLLQEISSAQENERRRVAVEIHDGVAQWMVGASYGIKACSVLVSELRLDDLQRELAQTGQAVQRSIKELRRTIANLRPLPLEELGLVAAVRQTAATLAEDGIMCHTEVDIDLPELSTPEEITTYRIVQEMLTNVRRHSGASEVTVHMQYRDGMYSVAVSDNGQGFAPEEVLNNEMSAMHMGLIGMKERAGLLGGCLTIDSGHGKGTVMRFAFPVSNRETVKATATVRD